MMRIFPPELEIGETEGFTAEKDIFGRRELGEGLTNVVSVVSDPMVIALDAQWGSGKTTFLKMWAGELRKAGFPVVFFDAFENDYQEDAFAAIAGQIIALTEQLRKADTPAAKRFASQAVAAGKVLLRSSIKIGTRIATAGALDAAELAEAGKAIAGEASDLADRYLGQLITKQTEQRATLQAFRDALSALPTLLGQDLTEGAKGEEAPAPKPLIFIVDELDRCRPVFALAILERIKHFFSVPHVHFVLGAHMEQLRNSVVVAYGQGIDAHTYLQKFIHLTVTFRDDARSANTRTASKYINYLRDTMGFKPSDREAVGTSTDLIRYVATRQNFSLRTIERIMSVLALALASSTSQELRPPVILAGLCILKVTAPDLYQKAKRGSVKYDAIAEPLGLIVRPGDSEDELSDQTYLAQWWRYCTAEDVDAETTRHIDQGLWNYNVRDRFQVVPLVANRIVDRLNPK